MKARALGFTGWALALFATIGLVLLGLIVHLGGRASEQERLLGVAKIEYDQLIKLRLKYRDQEALIRSGPPRDAQRPASWQTYLDQKAKEANLPTLSIREEASRGPLKESSFTVTVNAAAGAPIPRKNFVRFLDLVEGQQPGFKSKNVSFKFSPTAPEDLQTATATFSDYGDRQ